MGFFKFGGFPTKHYSAATMEDFSAWEAEVDPAGRLTTYGTSLFHIDSLDRDEDCYRFKDISGSPAVTADGFTHQFLFNWESKTGSPYLFPWAVADANDDLKDIETASGDFVGLFMKNVGGNPVANVAQCNSGSTTTSGSTLTLSHDTIYYCTAVVDPNVGTYGTITIELFSDSAKETSVGSISAALEKDYSFDFIGISSFNDGGSGTAWTGYIANYALTSGNPQLVVDPGFDKTEEGADIFNDDFSADTANTKGANWTHDAGNNEYDSDGSQGALSNIKYSNLFSSYDNGDCFLFEWEVANYSAGSVNVRGGDPSGDDAGFSPDVTADGSYAHYVNIGSDGHFYIQADTNFIGSVKNVTVKPVTFTHWTEGTGWAPEADSGSLTGKAVKVAGTASGLTQATLTNRRSFRYQFTMTRTAGSLALNNGRDVKSYAVSGTYTIPRSLAVSDTLSFSADASFAGTVDAIDVRPR